MQVFDSCKSSRRANLISFTAYFLDSKVLTTTSLSDFSWAMVHSIGQLFESVKYDLAYNYTDY